MARKSGLCDCFGTVLKRFTPIIILTAVCWLVFAGNELLCHGQLIEHGIIPRRLSSLPGILWAPFLHESFRHIMANTVPLLILGGILCARSKAEFAAATGVGIIAAGSLTWLLARNAVHAGASGLVFCYFGYLASLAFFNRNILTFLLSFVCLIGFGGILRGVLPTSAAISWEGRLAGICSGIALAWLYSRLNRQSKVAISGKPETSNSADVWR